MRSEWHGLREKLLFKTPVPAFAQECALVRKRYGEEFHAATAERKKEIIDILSEISIDMQSYLIRWHLHALEDPERLPCEEIGKQAEQNYALLSSWGQQGKIDSVKSEVAAINKSNLLKLSQMADRGLINNRWGNDAATGLTDAMRRGAVLVTTNPVMVNAVRKEDPATWDKIRDELKRAYPDSSPEQRASLMTMSVVLQNCRELRPIYEATKGKYGYVSLQINPRANRDSARMAEEVEGLYERLTRELNGTPNTVFKVPATKAGLDTVRRLTSKGIGCTITVNCSVDQNLAYAEVIEQGCARISFLVVMSGRLDDPIRDELKELGLSDAAEVAKWA
ncbi:MAG: transaldolase family protein, partial [Syntrophorhabdales bacterium]